LPHVGRLQLLLSLHLAVIAQKQRASFAVHQFESCDLVGLKKESIFWNSWLPKKTTKWRFDKG